MSKDNSSYVLLLEYTTFVDHKDIEFITENKSVRSNENKAIFRTYLQTAEEINSNKRVYSKAICKNIVEALSPKVKGRSLLMEIDHPIVASNGDMESQKKRAAVVELKNCGVLISEIHMEGNDIIATCETLSGFRGPDVRDLLLIDKAGIGFSLRAFSKVRPHPTMESVTEVISPCRPITYDIVTNPSHTNAKVISLVTESNHLDSWLNWSGSTGDTFLQESVDLLTEDRVSTPDDSKTQYSDYIRAMFESEFNKCKSINFKLKV